MLKNKMNNLNLHIWYYKKSCKKQFLFTDLVLLFLGTLTIIKNLNPIYLILIYFIVYFTSNADMISFSNLALACTPLNIKDTVSAASSILWLKSTIIIVLSLLFGIINAIGTSAEFNYTEHLIDILKFSIVLYPIFKFLCTSLYYISKKYRTLITYLIMATFALACFGLGKLDLLWSLVSFMILAIVTSLISDILIKRLSYETIFFREAGR